MQKEKVFGVFLSILLILSLCSCCPPYCPPTDPGPDEKARLSPPTVGAPLYECGTAVSVSGFVPGAKIEIYADGTTLIGGGVSDAPWGQSFAVNPALIAGQEITATQNFNGVMSLHSKGVKVVNYFKDHPEGLTKPSVEAPIHDCGGAVSVRNLVAGGLLEVFADSSKVGSAQGCGAGQWTFVNPLFAKDQKVVAVETLCSKSSPTSDAVAVIAAPATLPMTHIDDVYEGGKYCTVRNITNGAMVKVLNGASQIGGHYCPGGGQVMRLNPPPTATDPLTSVQSLCAITSDPSVTIFVKPCSELPAPIVGPLCTGDDFITVSGTAPDARIRISANGSIIGDGGGTRINLLRPVNGEETITVTQSLGSCTSPAAEARVSHGSVRTREVLTMKNGNPFFEAEAGESTIQALVYTRGTGCAPYFMAKTGSAQKVVVEITDSKGRLAKNLTLSQSSGYWDGKWDWTSTLWQDIPNEIPVGKYNAKLKVTDANGSVYTEDMSFYVIFSPTEVTAPPEFGISDKGEIGIWFYPPGNGQSQAIVYYLHPDDEKIFGQAIKLINGQTSAYDSSKLLMDWVVPQTSSYCDSGSLPATQTKRFVYSICTSETDVLDLLARPDRLAQCADCANMFVALLRAVGIPAHPATGDAAMEQGAIGWGFDTWTEARLKGPNGEQWYVFHPHDPPNGYGPFSQLEFGTNHPWANKKVNDLVIMADDKWISGEVTDGNYDVSFGYGTSCKEPDQNFTHVKSWLKHLCVSNTWGMGYWGKGHWTCSPPKDSGVTIQLDREAYSVGGKIRIQVTIQNNTEKEIRSVSEISVVDDDPLTKQWPDRKLVGFEEKISLKPGEMKSFDKSYDLPVTLFADHHYSVVVKIPEMPKFFTSKDFSVRTLYDWGISVPKAVKVKERFPAVLSLKNTGDADIKDLKVNLKMPRHIQGKLVSEVPSNLPAKGSVAITWELLAASPNAATQLIFTVESKDGGSVRIPTGVEIVAPLKQEGKRIVIAP